MTAIPRRGTIVVMFDDDFPKRLGGALLVGSGVVALLMALQRLGLLFPPS